MSIEIRETIIPLNIEEELKDSYLDYSMSVIVARALPDVRDGFKPVHRRILFGMKELNVEPGKPYKKSARIVGDVMGKYHPHGDAAIYDTLVRMAQDFSMRYPLVDGQGNFGSVDGDNAAAMRYTEARLLPITMEMLDDLEKETVDFVPNYDDTLKLPSVLPSKIPNLLVNGSSGIAVGMATNIPPHNLKEVAGATIALIDHPDIPIHRPRRMEVITDEEGEVTVAPESAEIPLEPCLTDYIKAPDFPTGGIIYGTEGVIDAYTSGRGRVIVRARANTEQTKLGRERIIITELPYQVNKARLIEKIADLVGDKAIEGISDIRDESDRDGMRVVIELKKDAQPDIILNQLYKLTPMQSTFGVIMLALVHGVPKVLNLKDTLRHFIDFRHEVVLKRTQFELKEAEARKHIVEGLVIAVDNIDEVVAIIKGSPNTSTAQSRLMERFSLSEIQAKAILDMRLARLTGLERQKLHDELRALTELIVELKEILASREKRMAIVKDELTEVMNKYGDARRTEIVQDYSEFTIEDMIAEEDMVITISHTGYIKRFPVSGFRRQIRGGKGSRGADSKEEDFIRYLFVASTHNYILFFTDKGRCYWLKVFEIPQMGRASKGKAIVNLINIQKEEKIAAFVNVEKFVPDKYIIFATRNGIVKKTDLMAYSNPRRDGIIATLLDEDDALIEAKITEGSQDIVLGTSFGMAVRFSEDKVRPMGRATRGVIGVRMKEDDKVVGMVVVKREGTLLVVSEKGYGKRSEIADYRITNRGGLGIITLRTDKVGKMVALMEVVDDDDLMIITAKGLVIRMKVKPIKVIGRRTQGVRLIRIGEDDWITDVARVVKNGEEEEEGEAPSVEMPPDESTSDLFGM
jgi:DNA gyrase subunit A